MSTLTELLAVDPAFALLAVVATYFAFACAATLGIGGAALLTPVLLVGMDAPTAVAAMTLPMLVRTGSTLWVHRRSLDRATALPAIAVVLPTTLTAALFTARVEPSTLRVGIALLIFAALAVERGAGLSSRGGRAWLLGWGAASGVAGGLTGISGPPLAVAVKGKGLSGAPFVATISAIMLSVQVTRLPAYVATGVLTKELVPFSLLLAAVSFPAVATGKRLLGHLDADRFRLALDVLLALLATLLLVGVFRS